MVGCPPPPLLSPALATNPCNKDTGATDVWSRQDRTQRPVTPRGDAGAIERKGRLPIALHRHPSHTIIAADTVTNSMRRVVRRHSPSFNPALRDPPCLTMFATTKKKRERENSRLYDASNEKNLPMTLSHQETVPPGPYPHQASISN